MACRCIRTIAVVTASLLLLASCGSSQVARDRTPAELGHVHDLVAVDGRLLLATHAGLYELVGDRPVPVGAGFHDLMAFSADEEGTLFASGHPDLQADTLREPGEPPLLGLLVSGDGGVTWTPRSLLGEADFHALVVTGDRIVGVDSSSASVLVSLDGVEWEHRGAIEALDLAVDPRNDKAMIAVAYDGSTLASDDGGWTWAAGESPGLVAVDWPATGGPVALGIDGDVHRADGMAGPWVRVGSLGAPGEALLVSGEEMGAAVEGPVVLFSNDGGVTWTKLFDSGA